MLRERLKLLGGALGGAKQAFLPWWVSLIMYAVTNWKEIRDLVLKLWDLIDGEPDKAKTVEQSIELKQAVAHFEQTGDSGPLERLYERLRAARDARNL